MRVLVTGSIAYDRIMNFPGLFVDHILPDKLHQISVGFLLQDMQESFGGTAANIAYSLALLGEQPSVVCNVGGLDWETYRRWLQQHRIATGLVQVVAKQRTAIAHVITDQRDNQIAGFFPGAMLRPWKGKVSKLRNFDLAIVSAQHPDDMTKFPTVCKRFGIPYIYDPAQQITALSKTQLLAGIVGSRMLIGNDYEMAMVMKKTGKNLPGLLRLCQTIITTFGERGSMIAQASRRIRIPAAKPRSTIDPTGAGDAYRAGIIKGMALGLPLEKIGRLGALTAVYAVEQQGTQRHRFNWRGLLQRYRQNFKQSLY